MTPLGVSEVANVRVRPRIAAVLHGGRRSGRRSSSAAAGEPLSVAFRTTPMSGRIIVRVERVEGGEAVLVQRHRLETARGHARLRFGIERPGSYRIRALTPANDRHAAGRSHTRTLNIR